MNKKEKVAIIGLGYVGAPLAYLAACKGYEVVGVDNNNKAIDKINKRLNVPRKLINDCNEIDLIATKDYSSLSEADIIIVCVPTPTINNKPNLEIFKNVIKNMSLFIKRGCLIIIESTVAPGMTKMYVEQYLNKEVNLKIGEYYDLAYCPERIDPGNQKYWVGNINRVCGASSKEALHRTCDFYKAILEAEIIPMESIEETELVKVWENSMRNISIAQANLLAKICDKYNFSIDKVKEGLESKIKQFGNSLAYPGLGPGGHCIPEDIHYLIYTSENNINADMSLLKEAVKINESMPKYAYDKLIYTMNKNGDSIDNMNILMLGKSYKPNSNDIRRSQAIVLYDIIAKNNTKNIIFDPIADNNINKDKIAENLAKKLKNADIIILGCPHNIFLDIDYSNYKNIKYVLDCWNKLDKEKIMDAGINYIGVGI